MMLSSRRYVFSPSPRFSRTLAHPRARDKGGAGRLSPSPGSWTAGVKSASSGSSTGSIDSGSAIGRPCSSYTIGNGSPQYRCREQPVAEPVGSLGTARAVLLEPGDDLLPRLGAPQSVQEAVVDHWAVTEILLAFPAFGWLDGADDGQSVPRRELPVALVLAGHAHDRARSIAQENVIGDEDRHQRAVEGVCGERAGEDPGLGLRIRLPVHLGAL